ncbi:hypothetical protein [Planctomicrobium piriforme]|uniref:Uncharacterized protein n=1 Tax=Planctomicrobium piriforme TaxID=1576369 RepID=A0A1I3G851_9PLAN|nr:hypothetical protein [Planctomicrobium piriforme]SFI19412.1 hypothetical protein SAMN05421753_106223 [Planctomicrobium piriforme]
MTLTSRPELDSEDQLVARAQQALSSCNWEIGACAAQWTQRYARGRTDADFGQLIGLSGDQVFQRRRVWETFADVYENYPRLKWSHFYVVVNWDDAAECLQWANDMEATVAEMKAWRRAQHGEDLSEAVAEEAPFGTDAYLTAGVGMVQDPDAFVREGRGGDYSEVPFESDAERPELATSAAREAGHGEYAPFGKGARGSAPGAEAPQREALSPEQVVKKVVVTLERAVAALSPSVLESFSELPLPLQQRLLDAVENLQARTAGLS